MNLWRLVLDIYKEKVAQGLTVCVQAVSNSMYPLIRVGDVLSIEGGGDLKRNDVIAFGTEDGISVHRFVAFSKSGVVTAGDQVGIDHKYCDFNAIIGKVVRVQNRKQVFSLDSVRGKMRSRVSIIIGYLFRFLRHLKFVGAGFIAYSSRVKFLERAYRLVSLVYLKSFIFLLTRNSFVLSVYLRNSFVGNDWVAGVSDIDLTIVISDLDFVQEMKVLSWIRRVRRVFFLNVISFIDTEVITDREVFGWQQGIPRPWVRMYGPMDKRSEVSYEREDLIQKEYRELLSFYQKIEAGECYLFFVLHYIKKIRRLGVLLGNKFCIIEEKCALVYEKAPLMTWSKRQALIIQLHHLVISACGEKQDSSVEYSYDNLLDIIKTLRFYYVSDANELYTYPYHEAMNLCQIEEYGLICDTGDFPKLLSCLKISMSRHCKKEE